MTNVTAINVFIEVDGKQCIAPIYEPMAPMFIGMLGAYQHDQPKDARLIKLPDDVAEHLLNARRALQAHFDAARAKKGA